MGHHFSDVSRGGPPSAGALLFPLEALSLRLKLSLLCINRSLLGSYLCLALSLFHLNGGISFYSASTCVCVCVCVCVIYRPQEELSDNQEIVQTYRLHISQDINQDNLALFCYSYNRYHVIPAPAMHVTQTPRQGSQSTSSRVCLF